MTIVEEKKSTKLPNLTSLYIKIDMPNKSIDEQFNQQPIRYFDRKTNTWELPINRLYFAINLLTKYDNVKFIPIEEIDSEQKALKDISFKITPFPYQLDGIEYGLNHSGWLLLDDQGLGKSLQMIYLAEVLKAQENLEHCLIICGVNGLKYNWAREIDKCSNLSYTILGHKTTKNGKDKIASVKERCEQLRAPIDEFFVITNLETLQSKDFADAFNKSKNSFGMIVVDEAHHAKNPSSVSVKNLLKLKSKHNIALTGTVITRDPEDAYVPLKWTGNLNCTKSAFNAMYNIYGGYNNVQVIGHKNLNLLQEHIASCSLRRLKTDVLELPDKTYQIEYVEMGAKQQALYDEVSLGIAEELDKLPKNKQLTIMEEMVMHMRQRQVTAWPGILTSENIPSAKLDRLEDLVETIVSQGDKVVVFSTFKSTVPEIMRRLAKYNPLECTGDQSDETINQNKALFEKEDKYKVLACTWQKMGTGHTLTAANYVIFVDTPWNDSDFKQCADRIYRIGQNKKCFIITLLTKNTYDERVQYLLDNKEALSGYLLDKVDSDKLISIEDYDIFKEE